MRESFIETADGRVYYFLSEKWLENAVTVIFLHGMTADHTMFEDQYGYFGKAYNIIAWDAPAHGRSRPFKDMTYPKAAKILADIMDLCSIRSAFIAGQSMGGYIAQSFIMRYPERVRGFIGIDTTPYGDGYYSPSDIFLLRRIEPLARLYPLNVLKKAMAKQVCVTSKGRENMLAMLSPYGKDELCRLMGMGYAAFLDDNRPLSIPCPVLIILGEKDRTGKVKSYCRQWAKRTGYPIEIIKNACHNSNADNPEAVNRVIDDFINKINNGSTVQ
ncbi:MAG: alpha/beta hydrolase [Ruminococcus sp.]|nr:alpha/beta hydrolase [Ruminococcus sp.]